MSFHELMKVNEQLEEGGLHKNIAAMQGSKLGVACNDDTQ